ncbi:uncharacterized protein LOC120001568 [Tripterygium wilfordii]|uniref:uncharacterized protein LOC120001568 n=1 Tax=Tripterygium wilfordii TaxID=458696 RepID=UPI0018F861C1|nr:uncharacterized protein LOC120001568 [Tripterygium wilfordii]
MAFSYPSHSLSASTRHRISTEMTLPSIKSLAPQRQWPQYFAYTCYSSMKLNRLFQNTRPKIPCAINMAAGHSGDPEKVNLDHLMDKARDLWDRSPQPVKSFPWSRVLENFIQLLVGLVAAVVKYLCVPVLGVSMLSEMSYCAHEKKLSFIPLPLLIGVAVAWILKETALELSPFLKDAEVPWHLLIVAIFFALLKLPGPYYPYWGRIFIPHFANGVLLRTLWFVFQWNRKPGRK